MKDNGRKKDPYRKLAARYDGLVERLIRPLRVKAMEMFPAGKGMRVLDVGCGTGSQLGLYLKEGCEIFGIDSSPSMLDVARKKLGALANLHLGDAANMPYSEGMFDLVMLEHSLHEMQSSTRLSALAEAVRVLKKSGKMLLVDYNCGPLKSVAGWFQRIVIIYFELLAGWKHFRSYRAYLRAGGLPALISEFNLKTEKIETAYNGNISLCLVSKK